MFSIGNLIPNGMLLPALTPGPSRELDVQTKQEKYSLQPIEAEEMSNTGTISWMTSAARYNSMHPTTVSLSDDWEQLSQNEPQDRPSNWEVLANRSHGNSLTVIEDLDAIGDGNFDPRS